ncbi:hypothetical protein [uncultured Cedecea sp.]|nr:hypothetical protein [uncultured Cedecea sp.]
MANSTERIGIVGLNIASSSLSSEAMHSDTIEFRHEIGAHGLGEEVLAAL